MLMAIKSALVILILLGIALAAGGAWELLKTRGMVSASSGKARALFAGYHRVQSRVPSGLSLKGSGIPSVSHYAEFIVRAEDGSSRTIRESKAHVFERYKEGEEVEILLFQNAKPRLAGFYSLYVRDLLILAAGLVMMLLVLSFWRYALPVFFPPVSTELRGPGAKVAGVPGPAEQELNQFLDRKIGPVSARTIFRYSGIFFGVFLIVALLAGLAPYVSQMSFGAGGRLRDALKEGRFDEARLMIEKGEGIHGVDEFNQNPLLISLEAGRMDLATMLVTAGADVNIRSKMLMTPLRAAAEEGKLEMVKLLLEKGALPQHPEDKAPPFLYAMANGHDEVARMLIEAGTDLHRRYPFQGGRSGTVGDLAVLAGRTELVELIRRRGGTFTPQ